MKFIRFRRFSDCFAQDEIEASQSEEKNLFFEQGYFASFKQGFSHPQCVIILLSTVLLLFSLKFRLALVLVLVIGIVLCINYLYLKQIAEELQIKFDPVKSTLERDSARLGVGLMNHSFFGVENLLFSCDFNGSVNIRYNKLIETEIAPDSMHRFGLDLICDAGMGQHEVQHFKVIISDPFNVFQFTVCFDEVIKVEVRPRVEEIPQVKTRGSHYSEMYGIHEIQSRGLSVNFSSLRPYSFGDSIRHVAWRPSAKHGSLVVKEFERMVNTEATLILNLNPTQHVGLAEMQSWESSKDICLALVSQLLEQGNSVQFVYNYGCIEKSGGHDQFYAISRKLIEHDMLAASEGLHNGKIFIDDPLGHFLPQIAPGTTLFYIGAVNYNQLRDSAAALKWLCRERVEVVLVLVNPLTIWPEFKSIDPTFEWAGKTSKINEILADLQVNGVRVFFVDMGGELSDHFREKPQVAEVLVKPKFSKRSS